MKVPGVMKKELTIRRCREAHRPRVERVTQKGEWRASLRAAEMPALLPNQ